MKWLENNLKNESDTRKEYEAKVTFWDWNKEEVTRKNIRLKQSADTSYIS